MRRNAAPHTDFSVHYRHMTCHINHRFWDTLYRDVVLLQLSGCVDASDESKTYVNSRISIIITSIKDGTKDVNQPQRTLDTLLRFVTEFKGEDVEYQHGYTLRKFEGLITDMQGTVSIESANILWEIQQVYNRIKQKSSDDLTAIYAIDKFVTELLFCASDGFVGLSTRDGQIGETHSYPSLAKLRECEATFSRDTIYRYFRQTPHRIPIQASIALVFWKHQIKFGKVATAHSELQAMQRSNDSSRFKVGEKFVRIIRPYGDLCRYKKLYSMRTRTTQEQVDFFESKLTYGWHEAVSSVLMATSTNEEYCSEHVTLDKYEGRGIPVLLEFDTTLVRNKRYFIHVDEVMKSGSETVSFSLPDGENEVLILPGLLIRYLSMEAMTWGDHKGYKIKAQFISISPDNLEPTVVINSQFGGSHTMQDVSAHSLIDQISKRVVVSLSTS